MKVFARVIPIVPLLYCPISIGEGDSASQGYRLVLLQNVTDQIHHMLTSGAHVP